MTREFTLDVNDIIRELNLGQATVNFMLERFARLLPKQRIQGRILYSPKALSTLIRIKDQMDQGLMPSQIEESMEAPAPSAQPVEPLPADSLPKEDIRMSQDALAFIQNLFQDIKGHQSRIARAHEKRAEAEERKAVAIEKRAEAEAKKAEAMNNIAAALQEMSRQRPVEAQTLEIAGQAAHALTMNETQDIEPIDLSDETSENSGVDLDSGLDDAYLDDLFSPLESDKELRADPDMTDLSPEDLDLDDLTVEMPDAEMSNQEELHQDRLPQDLDDLSQLMDEVSTPGDFTPDEAMDDLEDLLMDHEPLPDLDDFAQMDDLSQLVEEESSREDLVLDDLSLLVASESPTPDQDSVSDLDDLSLLVDNPQDGAAPAQGSQKSDLDNLYDLMDDPADMAPGEPTEASPAEDLDDLSLLVDSLSENPMKDLDDLSALVDLPDSLTPDLDDLSLLVESAETTTDETETEPQPMDDLSALIAEDGDDGRSEPAGEPSLKPDITPDQDMAKYKAAVMKIIIDLKNKGLSPADTTERLNKDEVLTLSGKPLWREKAIAKIYGFIDSAQ